MAGRPKKAAGEARDTVLRIRLTTAERQALDRAARAKGLETSRWARSELLALARKVLGSKEEARGRRLLGTGSEAEGLRRRAPGQGPTFISTRTVSFRIRVS